MGRGGSLAARGVRHIIDKHKGADPPDLPQVFGFVKLSNYWWIFIELCQSGWNVAVEGLSVLIHSTHL